MITPPSQTATTMMAMMMKKMKTSSHWWRWREWKVFSFVWVCPFSLRSRSVGDAYPRLGSTPSAIQRESFDRGPSTTSVSRRRAVWVRRCRWIWDTGADGTGACNSGDFFWLTPQFIVECFEVKWRNEIKLHLFCSAIHPNVSGNPDDGPGMLGLGSRTSFYLLLENTERD